MLSTLNLHKNNNSTIWSFNQRPEAYGDVICGDVRAKYFSK